MATLGTFTAGSVLTAAELNAGLPMTLLRETGAQSIPNNTLTAFTFGASSEVEDTLNWHDTASNTNRITPTIEGIYLVGASWFINYASGSDFRIFTNISRQTVLWVRNEYDFAGSGYGASTSVLMYMNGTTHYTQFLLYQQSGGARDVTDRNLYCVLLKAL